MGKKRQFDEEEVLQVITNHFWKHGYGATKMDQLAEISGLTKTSIYNAFGNKEALFLKALDFYLKKSLRGLIDNLDMNKPMSENLQTILHQSFMQSEADMVSNGCMVTNSIVELSCNEQKLYEAVTEKYKKTRCTMFDFFNHYAEKDMLAPSVSAKELTDLYMTFHQGLKVQCRNDDCTAILEQTIQAFITLIRLSEK